MRKYSIVMALSLAGFHANADDFFGQVETASKVSETSDSPWRYRAWLQQKTGYGYRSPEPIFTRDSADFTRTETQLYQELDWRRDNWRLRLAGSLIHDWLPDMERTGLWSGYEFTDAQADKRSWRWEVSDSYLSWQEGDWWVRGGYQTLAWGESELLKVTDVLARRDQRWPGQEDLEELRLPVPALMVSWNNRLDMVLLPDMPTDRLPAAYEEFDPYILLRQPDVPSDIDMDIRRGNRPGWALRWHSRRPGLDTQFILADVYSFDTAPTGVELGTDPIPHVQRLILEPWRQQIAGLALQNTRGNWLLKTEQAWHRGLRLAQRDPLAPWMERDQWRAMVAGEYSGIDRLTVTGEVSWSYTHNHQDTLAQDQWQTGLGLRANYTLFNERLSLTGHALRLNGGEGDLIRLSADWEWTDELNLSLSLVEYLAAEGDQLLYPYRHNDSVNLSIRWGLE